MKPTDLLLFAALITGLGLAGCSSSSTSRVVAKVGDTPALVEAAMGRPDRKLEASAGGHQSIWIYAHYRKQRPQATGWSKVDVPEVHNEKDEVVQDSVTREVFTSEVKEDIRVVFTDGKVSAVEEIDHVKAD